MFIKVETIFELLNEDTCRLVYTKKIREEFEVVASGLRIGKGRAAKTMERKDRYFVSVGDPTDAKFVTAARKGNWFYYLIH